MRVLFVASGNSKNFELVPFIKVQGDSLIQAGIEVQYFPITGKGIKGYIKAVLQLRRYLKKNPIDIIHAHYILSGWCAVLALSGKPIILSLMGSDAYGAYIGENKIKFSSRYLILLSYLIQPFVNTIICKSKHIESFVYYKKKSHVIPNGIMLNKFTDYKQNFRTELGLQEMKNHLLFLGSKFDIRKNYELVESSYKLLDNNNIVLISPYPVTHDEIVKYLNTVDCLIVPSYMEGSPNVVKEAMACNCPVVATDVGDVRWLFGDTPGYFIFGYAPEEVANKIKMAIDFSRKHKRTNGRQRLIELGLDAETIACRIVDLYQQVV